MRDSECADLHGRLRCVRGHLLAIARMTERGDDDLKIVQQLQAVQGALTQIEIRLLRAQLDQWAAQLIEPGLIENALTEILRTRRRHEFNIRHMSRLRHEPAAQDG